MLRLNVVVCLLDTPLALPAYDQCMKASHLFNMLDARGVISVTERAAILVEFGPWQTLAVKLGWP